MVLLGQTLSLVNERFHGPAQFLRFRQCREDSLVFDQLGAHRLNETLAVLGVPVELPELVAMSHVFMKMVGLD